MGSFDEPTIRAALASYRSAPGPRDIIPPENATGLPEDWPAGGRSGLRVAAILVPLVVRQGGEIDVLLTERAAHLRHHAGQISFPGGAEEAADRGLADTAVREAREEVGLDPSLVEVVGYLKPQWTISNFAMTPVIGLVSEPVSLELQTDEVADAFFAPASHVLDLNQHRVERRSLGAISFDTVEASWDGRRIWGATATVLNRLAKIINS
ncbi:MAG: CoA pyrophosphatase [Woeseiaceae bacterium]